MKITDEQLTLSNIRQIGPVQINPYASVARYQVEQYCKKHHIWLPQYHEYATMSSYLFPHTSMERLIVIGLVNDILYYIDDILNPTGPSAENADDKLQLFAGFMDILKNGGAANSGNPLWDVASELHGMMARLANPQWLLRFFTSLHTHVKSGTISIQAIKDNGVLNENKYIVIREHDSGMGPTLDLIEFSYGISLPEEIFANEVIKRLRQCTIKFAGLTNDLFSYHKEVVLRGQQFNLVPVLMESKNISKSEAINQIIRLLNSFVEEFLQLENLVPVWSNPDWNTATSAYVQGLKDIMIASYHWQISTNRYRSPDSPFPELQTMIIPSAVDKA